MAQKLIPIYEPLFADGSYGYRPGRSAKDAIRKVKEYAKQVYTYALVLDLSKYFDTLNHMILLNILRRYLFSTLNRYGPQTIEITSRSCQAPVGPAWHRPKRSVDRADLLNSYLRRTIKDDRK